MSPFYGAAREPASASMVLSFDIEGSGDIAEAAIGRQSEQAWEFVENPAGRRGGNLSADKRSVSATVESGGNYAVFSWTQADMRRMEQDLTSEVKIGLPPARTTDFGHLELPVGTIPGLDVTDIPIYVPEYTFMDGDNTDYAAGGWSEVGELFGSDADFDIYALMSGLSFDGLPDPGGELLNAGRQAGLNVLLGMINAGAASMEMVAVRVVIQSDGQGAYRAVIMAVDSAGVSLWRRDPGATTTYAEYGVWLTREKREPLHLKNE
jgi:hypothetical protein